MVDVELRRLDYLEREIWCWPEGDRALYKVAARDALRIPILLDYIQGRESIVQAGGAVGVWACILSAQFERVYTFEPCLDNLACLLANTADCPNVSVEFGALGEFPGRCHLENRYADNFGAWECRAGGDVPVYTIDGLDLPNCSALILDIEGWEGEALKGAENTIEAFRPTIVIEDKGVNPLSPRGAIPQWISERHNYKEVDYVGRDAVLVPC